MKKIILTLFTMLFACSLYSQDTGTEQLKDGKFRFTTNISVMDSTQLIWPEIVSVYDEQTLLNSAGQKTLVDNTVNFYPVIEKGFLYIELDNFSKEAKPELLLKTLKGEVIYKMSIRSRVSAVNINKLPTGTYTIVANLGEESTSWEIVKE